VTRPQVARILREILPRRRWTDADLRAHAADQHITFSQAMVLASIIEREAAFDKDRPYVAAVFYNRMAQGLPLQSDATVAYAKGQSTTVITEPDKALDSPFNTYLHTGLPPAPISNPGLASIRAALMPASGFTYLYFLLAMSVGLIKLVRARALAEARLLDLLWAARNIRPA